MSKKHKAAFYMLLMMIMLDTIASAIVMPIQMHILFPCVEEISCRVVGISDNIVLLSSIIFFLSPSSLFAAPILGRLSDIYGRKFTLWVCFLMSLTGYLLLLLSSYANNIMLALISILLLNASSSSMTPIQAAVADTSKGRLKALRFGMIAFAMLPVYLIIAEKGKFLLEFYSQLNGLVIIFALLLTVTNMFILKFYRDERASVANIKHEKFLTNTNDAKVVFSKNVLKILLLFALFQFATGLYFEGSSSDFLIRSYFPIKDFPAFLYYKVLMLTIGIFIIYPALVKRYSPYQILLISLVSCFISIIGCALIRVQLVYWILIAVFTAGEIIFIPTVWRLLSDMVNADNQGLIMGVKASIWSFTWTLGIIVAHKIDGIFTSSLTIALALFIMLMGLIFAKMSLIKVKHSKLT